MKNFFKNKVVGFSLMLYAGLSGYGSANAQSWQNVGNPAIVDSFGSLSLAINSNGTPYVSYQDALNGFKATVIKYDGSNWVTVGSPDFTDSNGFNVVPLVLDGNGTPYIVYQEAYPNDTTMVMKYDGSNWVNVGVPGFSTINYTSIAIDNSGTPYLAYQNNADSKATVMKYNGSSWVVVGNQGFTDSTGDYTIPIAIGSNGTPYIAYEDVSDSYKITVMKYDGNSWVVVGNAHFSPTANNLFIVVDGSGTPYVSYGDIFNNDKATVMKYNGSSWITVGEPDFATISTFTTTALAFDNNGTPYFAAEDSANGNKAIVMKYNGTNWVTLGNADFSQSAFGSPFLAIAGDGTAYVAYQDGGDVATVMKYVDNTSVPAITNPNPELSLSPNPTTNEVTIKYNAQNADGASLSITNITGQTVIAQKLGNQSGTVNISVSTLPAGIYMVQLNTGNEVTRQKLVKE